MKRKLFLVVLVAIVAMMFAACATSAPVPESPDKDKAIALYAEVQTLQKECITKNVSAYANRDAAVPTSWGRAESIQFLGSQYMEKKMYTEALQPLGQAKVYYTGYLK